MTERMTALLVAITPEYFLFAVPRSRRPAWAAPASPCAWPAGLEREFV